MKKEIKKEIDNLFLEMVEQVKRVGIMKEYSHTGRGGISIYYSKTIGYFRLKALQINKENKLNWNLEDRNAFSQGFGRKTTPYFWLKKELK